MENSNQEISKARTYAVDITSHGAEIQSGPYHPYEWEETKTFYFSSLEDAKLFAELKSQDPAIVGKPARDDFHDSRGWSYSEPYEITRDRQDIENLISQYRNGKSLPGFESERGRSFVKICEEKGLAPGDFIPEDKNIDEIPFEHWDEICKGIQAAGLGAKKMLEPGFDLYQLKAIRRGLEKGADMSFITPEHDAMEVEITIRSGFNPQVYNTEAIFFLKDDDYVRHCSDFDGYETSRYDTDVALSLIEQGADPYILRKYADLDLADLMTNCYNAGVSNEELNNILAKGPSDPYEAGHTLPDELHYAQKNAIYRKYGFSGIDTRKNLAGILNKYDSDLTCLMLPARPVFGSYERSQQKSNDYLESVLEVCRAVDDRYGLSTKQGIALLENTLHETLGTPDISDPENISRKAQEIRDGVPEPDKRPKHTSTWEDLVANAQKGPTSQTKPEHKDQRSKSDDLTL